MEVILVRVTKNGSTTPVPLTHERTLVGRLDDCHIRVPIAGMSRKHCEIVIEDGSITITDLGSSNGTYVNQERISPSQPLSAGDLVSFGGLVFLVSVNGEPGEIDAEMMFEDGIPDETDAPVALATPPASVPAPAHSSAVETPAVTKQTVPASKVENDESSMMDFDFDFDDDDEQPPL